MARLLEICDGLEQVLLGNFCWSLMMSLCKAADFTDITLLPQSTKKCCTCDQNRRPQLLLWVGSRKIADM